MLGHCPNDPPASEISDHSYVAYLYVEDVEDLCASGCVRC
jgi:hypothetical protein